MTKTSKTFEIKEFRSGKILFSSRTAKTLTAAVQEAVANRVDLMGANLTGANLAGANLAGAYLPGANLAGADLTVANLTGANLTEVNLTGANLAGANLAGANLAGADLTVANLTVANLTGAYLPGVNLTGANLAVANLTGAYLTGAGKKDREEIVGVAAVMFSGHGQIGRQLLAVKSTKTIVLWCGCFHGTPDELREFIQSDEPKYRKTRTLALKTVLKLLEAENEPCAAH